MNSEINRQNLVLLIEVARSIVAPLWFPCTTGNEELHMIVGSQADEIR